MRPLALLRSAAAAGLVAASLASFGPLSGIAAADVSAATPLGLDGAGCVQSFDSLASSGTSSAFPPGFGLSETSGDTLYSANDGGSNAGNTYSYGATGSTERALGSVASGTNQSTYGAIIRNDTGVTMTSLTLSFRIEQWRRGDNAANTSPFSYSTSATSLASGSFTSVTALDVVAPLASGTSGSRDGNAAANQATRTATLTGLSLAPAATLVLRWQDPNNTGADDGIGIDDLALAPNGATTPTTPCPAGTPPPPGQACPAGTAAGTVTTISTIQGSGVASSANGQVRTVEGIVTGLDDEVGSSFGSGNTIDTFPNDRGFFVQEEDTDADTDPATSEGIFIGLTSASTTLPVVGAKVQVTGTVRDSQSSPSFGLTKIVASSCTTLLTGQPLPTVVTIDESAANSQSIGSESNPSRSYYETLENMRVRLVSGVARSGGTNKFGELYVVPGTGPASVLLRTSPAEPGLLGTMEDAGSGNPANPYRPAAPSSTYVAADQFDTVSELVGPLGYSYGNYKIVPQVGALPTVTDTGVAYPNSELAPAEADERRIVSFNLENYFPTGGALDGGIVSAAEFAEKRDRAADAIGRLLQAPDVVAVQEIGDNQHLGATGTTTSQGTLDALAVRLGELGYGTYTAYVIEGNDTRGIDVGFLVKSTVTVVSGPSQRGGDTAAGSCSDVAGRLFDRPPLFLEVDLGAGLGTTWLVSNHWSSKSAPDSCRDAQADWVRSQAEALQGAGDEVIVLGDLNAFEDETPIAHLQQGGTLDNLTEDVTAGVAYSFQFDGLLQTLDHVAVTGQIAALTADLRYVHLDNDYHDRRVATDGHKVSDHDPLVLTLSIDGAGVPSGTAGGALALVGVSALGGLAVLATARLRRRVVGTPHR